MSYPFKADNPHPNYTIPHLLIFDIRSYSLRLDYENLCVHLMVTGVSALTGLLCIFTFDITLTEFRSFFTDKFIDGNNKEESDRYRENYPQQWEMFTEQLAELLGDLIDNDTCQHNLINEDCPFCEVENKEF